MAVTVQERKLLLDGEWIETGDWQDVNSPYSGETVARVARAGAEHARKALDAAEHAMRSPLPAIPTKAIPVCSAHSRSAPPRPLVFKACGQS